MPFDPRLGVAITLPKLNWVLRAAYSYFYQPPPLDTVTGSLLDFTQNQGLGFLPLQGERDIQQEYGITIPLRELDFQPHLFPHQCAELL